MKFGNTILNKQEFNAYKQAINLNLVDIKK